MDTETISINSSDTLAELEDVKPTTLKDEPCQEQGKNGDNSCDDRFGENNNSCSPVSSRDSSPFTSFKRVSKQPAKELEDDKVSMNNKQRSILPKEEETGAQISMTENACCKAKVNIICKDARFFLMKSNINENVVMSKSLGAWSTFAKNEHKLNMAFKTNPNVIVIFSVNGSGKFCGFARLASGTEDQQGSKIKINWMLPSQAHFGGVFKLDWISKQTLDFSETKHLYNRWNFGKPVKIGRDAQEIEPSVGLKLCHLFKMEADIDWTGILNKVKEANERIKFLKITKPISKGRKINDRSHMRQMSVHSYPNSCGGDGNKRPRHQWPTNNNMYSSGNHCKQSRLTYYGNYYDYPTQQNNYYYYGPPAPIPPPVPTQALPELPRYYDGPPMPPVLSVQSYHNGRY